MGGFCTKCGKEMRTQSRKVGYNKKNGYSYKIYNICDDCKIINEIGIINEKEKPKYSTYSVKDNDGWKWLVLILVIAFIVHMVSYSASKYESDNEMANQTKTPIPTESQEDYIASCEEYNHKEILRNPDEYIGKRIKVNLEITHVHEKSEKVPNKYYMAIKSTGLLTWEQYVIMDLRYDNNPKLLEKDIITVYGEIAEPTQTINGLNKVQEAPVINMRYVELKEEQ